jgi:predicted SpoU family rRNA methylase
MDILKLDSPVTSEHADHASLSTCVVVAYADRVCSAAVENSDWRSSVNQSTQCPVACLAVFQAHVNGWPKDSRVAFLPIRKEKIHRARLADADNNLVRMRGDELSDSAVAILP